MGGGSATPPLKLLPLRPSANPSATLVRVNSPKRMNMVARRGLLRGCQRMGGRKEMKVGKVVVGVDVRGGGGGWVLCLVGRTLQWLVPLRAGASAACRSSALFSSTPWH